MRHKKLQEEIIMSCTISERELATRTGIGIALTSKYSAFLRSGKFLFSNFDNKFSLCYSSKAIISSVHQG